MIASALRRTGRIATERPRAALWTLLALTSALVAVGIAMLAAANVDRWAAARPGAGASMVVYLADAIDDARARALVEELRTLRGVERVELVTADESARRLVAALGSDAALLEGVEVATLPASIEVTLGAGVRDVVAMSPTVRTLRTAPHVSDVVVHDEGEDELAAALGTVRTAAWTGAGIFALLALVIVLAAIRVRLDRSRNEMRVVHLLGASPSFTIVPTALAGALSGFVAAVLATFALALGLHVYGDALWHALARTLGSIDPLVPSAAHVLVFVAAGACLGLLGGGLAGASRVAR